MTEPEKIAKRAYRKRVEPVFVEEPTKEVATHDFDVVTEQPKLVTFPSRFPCVYKGSYLAFEPKTKYHLEPHLAKYLQENGAHFEEVK